TGMAEERLIRGLHPYIAERMQMKRLRKFDLTRLPSSDDDEVYLFRCVAKENPADERLVAFAQVRDLAALREHDGRLLALPTAEATIATCLDSIRRAQSQRRSAKRFNTNRIVMYIWPEIDLTPAEFETIVGRVEPTTAGAGLEEILIIARQRDQKSGELVKVALHITFDADGRSQMVVNERTDEAVEPLDEYRQKVLRASSRNTVYPYELTGLLGEFAEYDLDAS
ncbi:fused acetyl/propionyl-CoA carboxylase subunit alpha/methylmalonyl-CoA decarboxylase subunit alpha, partial [Nocardia gipuzkoensis]